MDIDGLEKLLKFNMGFFRQDVLAEIMESG